MPFVKGNCSVGSLGYLRCCNWTITTNDDESRLFVPSNEPLETINLKRLFQADTNTSPTVAAGPLVDNPSEQQQND